jgi:hypothetical protein
MEQADLSSSSSVERTAALEFFDQSLLLPGRSRRTQAAVIEQAADLSADRIARCGLGLFCSATDIRECFAKR